MLWWILHLAVLGNHIVCQLKQKKNVNNEPEETSQAVLKSTSAVETQPFALFKAWRVTYESTSAWSWSLVKHEYFTSKEDAMNFSQRMCVKRRSGNDLIGMKLLKAVDEIMCITINNQYYSLGCPVEFNVSASEN